MRKTRASRRNLLVAFAAWGIATGVLHPVGAEAKETTTAGGDASASGDGDGEITASVTVEYVTAGADGSGGGVTSSSSETVTVDPLCRYVHFMSPAELAARGGANASGTTGSAGGPLVSYTGQGLPDYEKHKNDSGGSWYVRSCKMLYLAPALGGSSVSEEEKAEDAQEIDEFYASNPDEFIWVEPGAGPPAPRVSAGRLARAAWKVVKIPAPTVQTNPRVGSQGATLVGMDTWVWATGETPTSVKATATAGSTSVAVTAGSSGLQLSAPDGKASCTGFGVAWHSGMPEGSSPCTISFNRSSAHLGGSTPLTIKVAYSASYTATDGSSGTLPAITTTSTVNLPVAEVQTLTTNGKNPRQN